MAELSKRLAKQIQNQVEKNFSKEQKFLLELVKTKSVNPGPDAARRSNVETSVARMLRKEFLDLGVRTRYLRMRSGRPNLVGVWGPMRARKSLLWAGHMDTAPLVEAPKMNVSIRDGNLYGPGVLDMKASLAMYLFALRALKDLKLELEGKLRFAFFADGKSDGPSKFGLAYVLSKGMKAKTAVLAKPGTDKIAIGHRGGYRFSITTYGESVNTGRRDWERGKKGRNAILEMSRATQALSPFDLPFKPARAFPGRMPVFTFPVKIQGGRAVDMVPDSCQAWGDVRLMPGNTDTQVKLWIEDKLSQVDRLKYEIEDILYVPSMEIDKNEGIVQVMAERAREVLGKTPKIEGCGPWNDAWMLTSRDIPCVAGFGPDGGDENGEEWVDLESLKKATIIYAQSAAAYLGIG
jgi:glutamate carboxypeptidase